MEECERKFVNSREPYKVVKNRHSYNMLSLALFTVLLCLRTPFKILNLDGITMQVCRPPGEK